MFGAWNFFQNFFLEYEVYKVLCHLILARIGKKIFSRFKHFIQSRFSSFQPLRAIVGRYTNKILNKLGIRISQDIPQSPRDKFLNWDPMPKWIKNSESVLNSTFYPNMCAVYWIKKNYKAEKNVFWGKSKSAFLP